jgi:hypothetical protein
MSVVPLGQAYIVANFKETQVSRLRVGQPVEIKADAFGKQKIHGKLDSFAPATGQEFALIPVENAVGNFTKITQRLPVKIVVDRASWARPCVPACRSRSRSTCATARARPSPRPASRRRRSPARAWRAKARDRRHDRRRPPRPSVRRRRKPPAAATPQVDWTKLFLGFGAMVIGQFMAILDIQIVAASLPQIQAGVGRQRRPDQLDPDRLPDPRGRDDPAVGISVAAVGHPARLSDLVHRLHRHERPDGPVLVDRHDDPDPGPAGLHRRGDDPDGVRRGLHRLPARAADHRQRDHGPDRHPGPDRRPDPGRPPDRVAVWRWLFFINVPTGLVVLFGVARWGQFDKGDPSLAKGFDWFGLAVMATS